VLVVDDNATNRRVLATHLTHAGYDVMLASGGRDALAAMRLAIGNSRPFDLVIADYQMPDMDGAMLGSEINGDPHLSQARVVLLTSMDRHGNVSNLARAGYAAYMTKPVRGTELRACIERVLERELDAQTGRHQGLVTRSSLAAEQGMGQYRGKVLVVEDNVVNQQVAKRFLQRLGCEVVVAENGQRGVDEYFGDQFGLVLMDVQMPVMDGLTAARTIRSRELAGHHVPIVALTASAMTDEMERCTAAGMDAVLGKPLELPRLCEILDRYGFRTGVEVAAPAKPAAPPPVALAPKPVDFDQLRTIVGDDRDFMNELCETFVESSGRIVEELERALSAGDRAVLSAMAHKLKGGSSSICAHELAKMAATLEKDAKEKPLPELRVSVDSLRRAYTDAAGYVTAEMAA